MDFKTKQNILDLKLVEIYLFENSSKLNEQFISFNFNS